MTNSEHFIPEEAALSVLFSNTHVANPFPVFAQLRSLGPVVPFTLPLGGTQSQAWMVTRMEEAVRILKDHAHFTVDPRSLRGTDAAFQHVAAASDEVPAFYMPGSSMVSVDEPDHRRLRRLVSAAFTPRYVEGLRPMVQDMAERLLDRVQDQGQMELVEDYAFALPINVISVMLGIPDADWPQIRLWSEALANSMASGGHTPGSGDFMQDFGAYAAHLVEEKRRNPSDDLISQLIAIEEEGDRLSSRELFTMITLLIVGGHETTSNLIGTGVLLLLDHPEQLEKLKADLSLVPAAVEELLRFNGPATIAAPRFATEEIELAGKTIKKGDVLIVALSSANHDEAAFTRPEELDIARTLSRHLAFGQGIHICLGAPLARLEGEIALTTLLKRLPNLQLAVPREQITWRISSNLRGVMALPVVF
jgi:cytochrome P450